jgi:hypothetical protein
MRQICYQNDTKAPRRALARLLPFGLTLDSPYDPYALVRNACGFSGVRANAPRLWHAALESTNSRFASTLHRRV